MPLRAGVQRSAAGAAYLLSITRREIFASVPSGETGSAQRGRRCDEPPENIAACCWAWKVASTSSPEKYHFNCWAIPLSARLPARRSSSTTVTATGFLPVTAIAVLSNTFLSYDAVQASHQHKHDSRLGGVSNWCRSVVLTVKGTAPR